MAANLPARIDFLLHCNFGDFILNRDTKQKLRVVLGEFGNLLTDDSWNGFGVFRSKMETIVYLVVNDALGNSIASFKEAIGQLDSLSRHHRNSYSETAETYLRSVRWAISGFQVFKNMDTHGQHGDIAPIHVPIVDCVKRYWSTLAYVQMHTIVCSLEWLHEALKAWKGLDDSPKGRAQSPTYPEQPARPPTPVPTYTSPPPASPTKPASLPPALVSPPSQVIRQPLTTAVISPPRMNLPAAPIAPPAIATTRLAMDVAVVPSPPPAASMVKLATDVYNELERRERLDLKPRNYAKCNRTVCTKYNCNFAHTKEELKIVGVARAIAIGDVWKSAACNNPSCQFAGCDYLHEDDKRTVISTLKSYAVQLVDHVRVSESSGSLLVVTFSDGKTVTVKAK